MHTFVQNAVGMTAVLALLLLARPWAERHIRPQTRHTAWLIVCVGLLFPFRLPIAHFWTVEAPQMSTVQTVTALSLTGSAMSNHLGTSSVAVEAPSVRSATSSEITPLPMASATVQPLTEPLTMRTVFSWPQTSTLLLLIYLAGAAATLCFQCARHISFFRRVRRWRSEPEAWQLSVLAQEEERLGGSVRAWRCACVASPMVTGLRKPILLLPELTLEEEELRFIIRHELTHVKRHDLWGKALMLLCLTVHWFNPFVYVMARAMASDCEMSCDASVLANAGLSERKRYGETILGVIRRQNRRQAALSTYFYEGKNDMKKRFASMLELTSKPRRVSALAVVLALTLLSGSVLAVSNPTPLPAASQNTDMSQAPIVTPISTMNSTSNAPDVNAGVPANWDMHKTPALFGINGIEKNAELLADTRMNALLAYNRPLTRAEWMRLYDLYYFYDHDGRRAKSHAPVADENYAGDTFAMAVSMDAFTAHIPLENRNEGTYSTLFADAKAAGLLPFMLLPESEMDDEQLLQFIEVVDEFDRRVPFFDPGSVGEASDLENRSLSRGELIRMREIEARCEADESYRPQDTLTDQPSDGLYIKGYNGGGETVYHYPESRELRDEELLQMAWEHVKRRQQSKAERDYENEMQAMVADAQDMPAAVGTAVQAVTELRAIMGDVNVGVAGEPSYDAETETWTVTFDEIVPVGASKYEYTFRIDMRNGDLLEARQDYFTYTGNNNSYLIPWSDDPNSRRAGYQVDATSPHWAEVARSYLAQGRFYGGAEVSNVRCDNSMNNFCVKVDYDDGTKAFIFLDCVTDALLRYELITDEEIKSNWIDYQW